jgi:hypothetical protein
VELVERVVGAALPKLSAAGQVGTACCIIVFIIIMIIIIDCLTMVI